MNRFVKVLLWAAVLGLESTGLWPSGWSDVAADEPKAAVKERITLKCPGAVSVAFSPDGKTLASAGYSDAIKLWHVRPAK